MAERRQHSKAVERTGTAETVLRLQAEAHSARSLERLLMYADAWRRFAHEWAEQAKVCDDARRAARLRHRAQAALHAANDAEELFKTCDNDRDPASSSPPKVPPQEDTLRSDPPAATIPFLGGPVGKSS